MERGKGKDVGTVVLTAQECFRTVDEPVISSTFCHSQNGAPWENILF